MPPRNTVVPSRGNKSKKTQLGEFLARRKLGEIRETEWRELVALLSPISESYLRKLLEENNISVEPPFGGVRQKTFGELEQSLLDFERVYTVAKESGDRDRAQLCRSVVIQAKDHARLAARSPNTAQEKKAVKEEMIQWMLVWLENPGVFPAWVRLRRPKLEENA